MTIDTDQEVADAFRENTRERNFLIAELKRRGYGLSGQADDGRVVEYVTCRMDKIKIYKSIRVSI